MNAFDLLLDQWIEQVKEIFPRLHAYQQKSIAFCVQGIIESGNAVMQRVAEAIWANSSSDTKMVSHERRFQRFVENDRIDVESCWNEFLRHILPFWKDRKVTLVLDMTPYTDEMTVVYVGILVQGRILPLCWRLMPQQEQWDRGQWEIIADLFERIAPLDLCPLGGKQGAGAVAPAGARGVLATTLFQITRKDGEPRLF